MTLTDVINDHTRRVAEVTLWHAMGWISDNQRLRYEVSDTEATQDLFSQLVQEAH